MRRRGTVRQRALDDLKRRYVALKDAIQTRLGEFRRLGDEASDEDLFAELVFCLFTPQSKARQCWAAVERLRDCGLLLCGEACEVAGQLKGVRFHNTKAANVVALRELFTRDGHLAVRETLDRLGEPRAAREWLVANVRGLGYKEATHFLRNIGRAAGMAILDRHILRNLVHLGVIEEMPRSLSRRKYMEIEEAMVDVAQAMGITVEELDLLLWCKETSDLFK
ncbi:MAG: N-glycosylase/DNA lyase [Armatimonadetes bacterium]|nr:N-glycosylase/DNA lyase [Armatimonadota bacterium]